MLSFDDIGAEAIPGLNLKSLGGVAPAAPAPGAVSGDIYSAGNSHRRVRVEDKRIINARADVNQLVPSSTSGPGRNTSPVAPTTGCRRKST